jgi:hypothetical protein
VTGDDRDRIPGSLPHDGLPAARDDRARILRSRSDRDGLSFIVMAGLLSPGFQWVVASVPDDFWRRIL